MPVVKECLNTLVLKTTDDQCKKLCVKNKGTPSVLRVMRESQKHLTSFKWIDILCEIKDRAPDILDILVTIAIPSKLKRTVNKLLVEEMNLGFFNGHTTSCFYSNLIHFHANSTLDSNDKYVVTRLVCCISI